MRANLELVEGALQLSLNIHIIDENYILSQSNDFSNNPSACSNPMKYDMVIANPPYFKLSKEAPEAASMRSVCFGAPNIYFLFAAMSLFNLRHEGEMVYVMPRSWTSGAYFSSFRNYFLSQGRLSDIHLFDSRDKVFDKESVLQETMIVKLIKTQTSPRSIDVSSSVDSHDLGRNALLTVPYDVVVSGRDNYVYLVRTQEEIDVVKSVNSIGNPMPSIGLKMKTGLTVDFRNRELLRNSTGDRIVPLFYAQHIKDGQVVFPIGKENEYMTDESPGRLQLNKNYLFVKRFTSKEERRRLQCGVYLARRFPEFKKISTQNKINFIDTIDGPEMSEELVYGLYAIFNSSLYDMYYRILNGSTQVNATEMNAVAVPTRHEIERLGRKMMSSKDFTTAFCDKLLEGIVNG
ncbi:MAG: Eco57I restriction-modification methylase domain-containing protein [Deltaproteobacteria bacterium]|nr:Eco57I restriction-modification methylase domain-containing protein [Deltaproteobacteria bacterium]